LPRAAEFLDVSDYLFVGLVWMFFGVVQVYRTVSGTKLGAGLIALNHSQPYTASKKQLWMNALFGVCYLAFGFIYPVSTYLRHVRHLT